MYNSPMRPKKPRHFDGVRLADNLYPDNKKRQGYWRYRKPDGRFKTFQAASAHEANRLAEEANGQRDTYSVRKKLPERHQTIFHALAYIEYRERINPGLKHKASWYNRTTVIKAFARQFESLKDIQIGSIRAWWDGLTHSQQKLRMAEFRKMFNWFMGQGLVPKIEYNPFTLSDDLPRLLLKEKPPKARPSLTEAQFWQIYHHAPKLDYECLQIAMGISRYTTLREADVCSLRFDQNVVNNRLRVVVAKSEHQKGTARAARLEWDLDQHPRLKKIVNRARELALINKACPYIVSHNPLRRKWTKGKQHLCQVLPERIYRMFVEVRDSLGIEGVVFHEVRGLAATLLRQQGYSLEQIKGLMAQEHVNTTAGYISAEDLPYELVDMKVGE